MLSDDDNEYLTRTGPGTPMGTFMREYWIPAMTSSEVAEPDCDPVRVLLLSERLIGFRDTSGQVVLIQDRCPHRGASLFYGRNEEGGLRCIYHGWKFGLGGGCLDMPNEPPGSNFKDRVKARTYPCVERGGVIWTYMGPREVPPPLPDLPPNVDVDNPARVVEVLQRDCNWLQALEGDVDTSHFGFLHSGHWNLEDQVAGTFNYYATRDRAPRFTTVDTPTGTTYGAYRDADPGYRYWRIANFHFPFFTQAPFGSLGFMGESRAWVPMDDHHAMLFSLWPEGRLATPVERGRPQTRAPQRRVTTGLVPNGTGWYERFRVEDGEHNDYGMDRERQRHENFSGLASVQSEDQVVTESMGSISDRSEEHLSTADAMVIRVRRRLIAVCEAYHEGRLPAPGVDEPGLYHTRSGGVILPEDADWLEATAEARRAGSPVAIDPETGLIASSRA